MRNDDIPRSARADIIRARLTSSTGRLERGDVAPDETTVTLKLVREVACAELDAKARDVEDTGGLVWSSIMFSGQMNARLVGLPGQLCWSGKVAHHCVCLLVTEQERGRVRRVEREGGIVGGNMSKAASGRRHSQLT